MSDIPLIDEAYEMALKLSPRERLQLIERVASSLERDISVPQESEEHWGRNLIALINSLDMSEIELVDAEITDSVEWVKAQRQKDASRLDAFWNGSQ